jgi:Helix-turn-helix domain
MDAQPIPDLLTRDETINYLRLDVDDRNPKERLRNLVRRQGLPEIKKGKLRLYRRSAVDAWLSKTKAR